MYLSVLAELSYVIFYTEKHFDIFLKKETIKNSPENHKKSSKIISYYFFIGKMKGQSKNK